MIDQQKDTEPRVHASQVAQLKIYFVNRYFYPDHSATSQLLSDLAFFLAEQGAEVVVVTSRQIYDSPASRLPSRETIQSVEVRRIWTTGFGRSTILGRLTDYLTFYASALCRLGLDLSSGDCVVAETDPPMISLVAALTVKLRGGRLINWCHDLFPEVAARLGIGMAKGWTGAALRVLRNYSLRAASTNVVLGERMGSYLSRQGIDKDRIRVIHNWSDGAKIKPLPRGENPLRDAWGLGRRFVVGYSGNLGRAHEFATVIEAAARLRLRDEIVFVFIGDGTKLNGLKQQAHDRGLNNVLFKPYQPTHALRCTLNLPDLHLVSLEPSLEGLIVPSKFYGVTAAGRPTLFIGDPDGEIPQILREENCGHTCAVGDVEGVKEVIEDLASNPGLCTRLGSNARSAFERRFERMIALKAWADTIAGHQPP